MNEPVHQLIKSEADRGRRTLSVRCGAVIAPIKTNDDMPDTVTGWDRFVTCKECKR